MHGAGKISTAVAVLVLTAVSAAAQQPPSPDRRMADTVVARWPKAMLPTLGTPGKWTYEEGVLLVRSCRSELDRAELVIRRLVERNGSVQTEETSPSELFGGEG